MVSHRSPVLLLAALALTVAACDSGASSPGTSTTTTATTASDATVTSSPDATTPSTTPDVATTTEQDTVTTPGACGMTGFDATAMTFSAENGFASLRATTSTTPPLDSLSIEIYQSAQYTGGATGPGTYDLTDPNYVTCANCVVVRTGCQASGKCDKTYFVDEGQMVIEKWDVTGGVFKGHLVGAKAKEVTIDSSTYVSTPVEGGATWCLDGFQFEAAVKAIPVSDKTEDACVANGTGNLLHDNVGDLTLKNCNGDPVHLHATCAGETNALWLIGTAGWCTACHEFIDAFRKKHTPNGTLTRAMVTDKTPGLDMIIILAENLQGEKPSQEYCKAYAEDMKLDPAMVVMDWSDREVEIPLVDPDNASITTNALGRTWQFINPYLKADSSGSVTTAYPWWAILKAPNMEYMWSDGAQIETFDQALEDLLGRFPSELF